MTKKTKKLIGYCGVDSGSIMITDPCYLGAWKDNEPFQEKEKGEDGNYSYRGACEKTCGNDQAGQLLNEIGAKMAVVSTTGFGDGVYPVYAEYDQVSSKETRIKSLTIKFY